MKRQRREVDNDGDGSRDVTKQVAKEFDRDRFKNRTPADLVDTFSVETRQYDRPFPNFRQPVEVGSFSQDATRAFHHDRRQLRYFVRPALADPGFDLRQGYASMIRKDETVKEYLNDLLLWVMRNRAKFTLHRQLSEEGSGQTGSTISSLHTDFICWRGLLTKLLCTPYERLDDWKIAVTRFRGTLYLCEFETDRKRRQQEQMSERQQEMAYWGWKFEHYVTAQQQGGPPDPGKAVNNNEGFCSVVRTRLQSHSLVYGGEVDCWDGSIIGDNKYVELKTSRTMETQRQRDNFKRFKLLKWWAQSFLLGIRKIVSGFRDDEGVVHSVEDFLTGDIPSLIQDVRHAWQPNVCFNFLHQLLSFIRQHATIDHPRQVYLLQWSPGGDVQLTNAGTQSPLVFLPPWFVSWDGWEGTHPPTPTTTPTPATTTTTTTPAKT